jgi:uncharacterized protein YdhG (YjbR/CyaY superfamily)
VLVVTSQPRNPADIDTYIAAFSPEVRKRLQQLREAIHSAAPDASEKISYQMPTFFLHGNLVHFAAWPQHIGLYPMPSALVLFRKELSKYASSKGAVQFPYDQPLPLALIRRMVKFRVQENLAKRSEKQAKKKKSRQG